MRDINRELVKFYLEERGYMASFGVICTHECLPAKEARSRGDLEIDLVAVKISGGRAVSAIIGCIKGYWTGGRHLTPSMIRNLEDDKKILSRAFSDARMNFVQGRFGLGDLPLEKVLFFSLRSPKKSDEAERILDAQGIRVVYLEEIVAEILPRLRHEPHLAESETLQTLKALKGTRIFKKGAKEKKGAGGPGNERRPGRRGRKRKAEPRQLELL